MSSMTERSRECTCWLPWRLNKQSLDERGCLQHAQYGCRSAGRCAALHFQRRLLHGRGRASGRLPKSSGRQAHGRHSFLGLLRLGSPLHVAADRWLLSLHPQQRLSADATVEAALRCGSATHRLWGVSPERLAWTLGPRDRNQLADNGCYCCCCFPRGAAGRLRSWVSTRGEHGCRRLKTERRHQVSRAPVTMRQTCCVRQLETP